MKTSVVIILAILVVIGGILAFRPQPEPLSGTLYIAVPMGIFVPFNQVATLYEQQNPEVEFKTMVDTPEIMAQACQENESKPDIFISPGGHEATVLREEGLIDPETMVAFGSYEVAVLVPKGNPGKIAEAWDLLNPEVELISFSPPDLTAASHAARQSLQNLGLWQQIEEKVKVTGCCNESFQWVVDGRAQANVQFVGCPMDTKSVDLSTQKAEIACILPSDSYYTPRNVAGILTTSEQRKLADHFLAFMTSPEMIELMATTKLRNDQNLPLSPGPWGPEQESGPMKVAQR